MNVASQIRQSRLLLVYAIVASASLSCILAIFFVHHVHASAKHAISSHATSRAGQITTRFEHRLRRRWKSAKDLQGIPQKALDRALREASYGWHVSRMQLLGRNSAIVHTIDARPFPKDFFAHEGSLHNGLQNRSHSMIGTLGDKDFVRAVFPLRNGQHSVIGAAQIWIDVTYGISIAERANKQSLLLLIVATLSFAALLFFIGEILVRRMGVALKESVRSNEELERSLSLARVGLMVAGLSHQLRNPISVLTGIVSSLNRRAALDEQRPFLKALTEETQRMKWLTETFLDFARPIQLSEELQNVREIVQRIEALIHSLRDNIKVECNGPESLNFTLDAELIYEALSNIATNSVEAIKQNNSPQICLDYLIEGGVLILRVTDNGGGFAREQIDKLRKGPQPFYSTKAKANGLGLAIAEKVVAAHGGSVELSNIPSGGARVTLRIPEKGKSL